MTNTKYVELLRMNNPRLNKIIEYVEQVDFADMFELADAVGVSVQTIRRDVRLLAEKRLLDRYHGGVTKITKEQTAANQDYELRRSHNDAEKQEVAKLVVDNIEDNSSVFLTIGTTMEAVARALKVRKGLTILTNSLKVANILHEETDFDIIIPSGMVQKRNGGLASHETEEFIKKLRVDYLLFSCAGVDSNGYVLDYYLSEVNVVNLIRDRASRAFLVVDDEKFSVTAPIVMSSLQDVDQIYSNRPLPRNLLELANDFHVGVNSVEQ